MDLPLFRSILRPISRVLVGLIAIPIFRFITRKVFRLHDLDDELEKDLEEWFRGALLLLAATANMEHLLFGWMQKVDWLDRADWLTMGLRLLLAIGVIEAMPDQELFAVLHPGPPKLEKGRNVLIQVWQKKWSIIKGVLCRHLNRSSPVLAMMCAIIGAQLPEMASMERELLRQEAISGWICIQQCAVATPIQNAMTAEAMKELFPELKKLSDDFARRRERWLVGWVCYLLAITQYLIIGLVTSRDRAMDMLSEFDRAVAERRQELIEEFNLQGKLSSQETVPTPEPQNSVSAGSVPASSPDSSSSDITADAPAHGAPPEKIPPPAS